MHNGICLCKKSALKFRERFVWHFPKARPIWCRS